MIKPDEALERLRSSDFRAKWRLSKMLRQYAIDKTAPVIREHAEKFIRERLAPAIPPNDGAQTPMKGHPAFIAQHATATCCRGCLEKWHKIPKDRPLTPEEQRQIVALMMEWMRRQIQAQ